MLYVRSGYKKAEELLNFLNLLKEMEDVGVELEPMWRQTHIECLKNRPIALCEAKGKTEFSESLGSKEDIRSLSYMKRTLETGKILGARYIVFHYNHCAVASEEKSWHLENAKRNLQFINYMNRQYGIPILIENSGVKSRGDNLFTEEEFVEECRCAKNSVVLDVKNVQENAWNLERLIAALKNKIVAYRLYKEDEKQGNMFGGIDFYQFQKLYQTYTPKADIILEWEKGMPNDLEKTKNFIVHLQKVLSCESGKAEYLKKQAV